MNRLIKFAIAAGVIAPALMAGSAFAATIPATTVFNGQTQAWGNAGQSVTATFRVNVAAGEVVHAIRTKVDSQATVCTPVGPYEGAQDVDVAVDVVLPPNSNAGGYNLTAELFTTATLPQAQAMTGNLACTGTNINAYNGVNVLHVLPTSGSTSGSTGGSNGAYTFMGMVFNSAADFLAWIKGPTPTPTPTPTVDPVCTEFKGDVSITSQGSSDMPGALGPVSILQSFLMSKGYDIPLLRTQAAKYGYFGPQTAAAVQAFRNGHASCI